MRSSHCNFPKFCSCKMRRLFDVSKQVVGQMFVHAANLLVSGLGSHRTSGNACVSYFLNILIDTTFGESGVIQSFTSHIKSYQVLDLSISFYIRSLAYSLNALI